MSNNTTFSISAFGKGFFGSAGFVAAHAICDSRLVWDTLSGYRAREVYRLVGQAAQLAVMFTQAVLQQGQADIDTLVEDSLKSNEVSPQQPEVLVEDTIISYELAPLTEAKPVTVSEVLPEREPRRSDFTCRELLAKAKEVKLPGYSRVSTDELFTLLKEGGHLQ